MSVQGASALLASGAILLLVALMPALVNGQPILFPDSVGYFHAGYAALQHWRSILPHQHPGAADAQSGALAQQARDGIATSRSVYYGALYVWLYQVAGEWSLPILQALVCIAAVGLAVRRIAPGRVVKYALIAGLFALCGLNFFAVTIMPDVFAGLELLAIAMILAFSGQLSRGEYAFWIALVLAGCLFHKGHVVVLIATSGLIALFSWQRYTRDLVALAVIAFVAAIAHFAVDLSVERITGHWPVQTPFLLARMVGDGSVEPFLRKSCPTRLFATCVFLKNMPMTENDFLWSVAPGKSVMGSASADTRRRISDEASQIEIGAFLKSPLSQAKDTVTDMLHQFVEVGVTSYNLPPTEIEDQPPTPMHRAIEQYNNSGIANGTMPLKWESVAISMTYFASLLGAFLLLFGRPPSHIQGPRQYNAAVFLLIGLAMNAIVFGAISGVFDRYQGRVAWLAPLSLMFIIASRRGMRSYTAAAVTDYPKRQRRVWVAPNEVVVHRFATPTRSAILSSEG